MAGIKLIFFDMEGTIFRKVYKDSFGNTAPSKWSLLAEHLGSEAREEVEKTKEKWTSGGYSGYVEWMEDTLEIFKRYGLKKDFFYKVMETIDYHPNVKETFAELRRRGYETALISGGFKAQADKAQKELLIDHAIAACEMFWDEDGELLHYNLLPCDYEGKLDFMHLISKEHGLEKDECAFVGDGRNDIPFAKAVGLSIAFNGAPELQEVSTHALNHEEGKEDFLDLLNFFD